jgi:hypothetical protein
MTGPFFVIGTTRTISRRSFNYYRTIVVKGGRRGMAPVLPGNYCVATRTNPCVAGLKMENGSRIIFTAPSPVNVL